MEIFEDTEISKILEESGRPQILPEKSTTSAVRYRDRGVVKQMLTNQLMKVAYHMGVPAEQMNRIYEGKLGLNSKAQ